MIRQTVYRYRSLRRTFEYLLFNRIPTNLPLAASSVRRPDSLPGSRAPPGAAYPTDAPRPCSNRTQQAMHCEPPLLRVSPATHPAACLPSRRAAAEAAAPSHAHAENAPRRAPTVGARRRRAPHTASCCLHYRVESALSCHLRSQATAACARIQAAFNGPSRAQL